MRRAWEGDVESEAEKETIANFFQRVSSVAQSCPTLWIKARQASLYITSYWSLLKLMPIESVIPSSHLILDRPLLLLPPIPPNIRVFSNESTLHVRWPSIGVSASASVLPMHTQDWSPLGWTGWISLQSKGLSGVFSNIQFKSINFSVLSFPDSPTFTSIHDHWKNHSLDQTDLCWQSNVSAF